MPDETAEMMKASQDRTGTDQLSFFRYEWGIYQKLLRSNEMNHQDVAAILRLIIDESFDRPFRFIDLACGDSSVAKTILGGTRVTHYLGIDLSRPALVEAEKCMTDAPYEVDFLSEDMVAAVESRPASADMIWCGLSMHHLTLAADKQTMLAAVHRALKPDGVFVCFEPTCNPGETRSDFLPRWHTQLRKRFQCLSTEEFDHIWQHIRTYDYPETSDTWLTIGKNAGFSHCREIFSMPGDLFCAAYLYEKQA